MLKIISTNKSTTQIQNKSTTQTQIKIIEKHENKIIEKHENKQEKSNLFTYVHNNNIEKKDIDQLLID